jgi:hypothetical protein
MGFIPYMELFGDGDPQSATPTKTNVNSPKNKRVKLELVNPPASAPAVIERVILVVGAAPECAESIAQSFANQGEKIHVIWFEMARQALSSNLLKALAGVIVCHRTEENPEAELHELRRALPDTPVLPWQVA